MGIDLTDDYNKAKSKISSYQTVVENKKNDLQQKKEKAKSSLDKKKSEAIKQAKELDKKAANFKNSVKSEIKNQLEQLLDLFKRMFAFLSNCIQPLYIPIADPSESTSGP